MVMIEISESKVEKMSDYAEKMVRYGGKLMQCLEELSSGESMGERGGYGGGSGRGSYGNRRGVRGTGRYSRYR